ncbi:RNA-binding KH domain-containing protein [Raphanus sativus]|uniref:KRR-R motif-containing protein 1 n=1 Tax=Raphanus sativus TaxID=3726 RepID=A0A9W3DFJ0_RAPSA|nr:KRR1 small subunit processome component-like isoform X1 [Raphanus sativus]KAJ4908778.1 RNA-binding KH domain-containing protein [Raphanus sativus]
MAEVEEIKNLETNKCKQNKRKPWDDGPCLDRWEIEKFDPSWNPSGMLEVGSFSRAYPKRREKHLLKCWPRVKSALEEHGVSCELNVVGRYMSVSKTKMTRDPDIIVKARDLLRLLARSVPARQALKILEDDMAYDIINIRRMVVGSKELFLRRRSRFWGHKSSTLKALEKSTNCFIRMQGNTIAAMGSFGGLRRLRSIVETCFYSHNCPLDVLRVMDAGDSLDGCEEMDAEMSPPPINYEYIRRRSLQVRGSMLP